MKTPKKTKKANAPAITSSAPAIDPNIEKSKRAELCSNEVNEVLKKHNCDIKAIVVIQELGPIIYQKQIYTLD